MFSNIKNLQQYTNMLGLYTFSHRYYVVKMELMEFTKYEIEKVSELCERLEKKWNCSIRELPISVDRRPNGRLVITEHYSSGSVDNILRY